METHETGSLEPGNCSNKEMFMKLKINERQAEKKSQAKALRREGLVPAVIYHRSKEAEAINVNALEFSSLLRKIQPGRLSTTIFTLEDSKGNPKKAIIKDIQYNPVSYDVIHLDFEELIDNIHVNIKVPIEFVGVADCAGIKLGGFLRQVKRHMRVNCLPEHIPTHFQIDIRDMVLYDSKRIKDLTISDNLRPLTKPNDVVLVIAKR
jgi:large subunit ribosomal protein L25